MHSCCAANFYLGLSIPKIYEAVNLVMQGRRGWGGGGGGLKLKLTFNCHLSTNQLVNRKMQSQESNIWEGLQSTHAL